MKITTGIMVFLAVCSNGVLCSVCDAGGWRVSQLTNGSYNNQDQQISGSNIVWRGNNEIFLYKDSTITQLTNNSYVDQRPVISGTNVAWESYRRGNPQVKMWSDICFYDGSNTTVLTSSDWDDTRPQILGTTVVWEWCTGTINHDSQISLNGTLLTAYYEENWSPKISESHIAWVGTNRNAEIYLYDRAAQTLTQLTTNAYDDYNLQLSGSNAVWMQDDGNDTEIWFYNGSSVIQLTNNDYDDLMPQISGSNIVWVGQLDKATVSSKEIFLYNGSSITQLTNNSFEDSNPQISGTNIVWDRAFVEGTTYYREIFLYNGEKTFRLTYNNYTDAYPQISGSNVVWQGWTDEIYAQIFMAVPCAYTPAGDFNSDCKVDSIDFMLFAQNWLVDCSSEPSTQGCVAK